MRKNWQDFLAFLRFVVQRFDQDRCMQIAGSLTFTTLLSLVPLITIALTLFSAFPAFQDFSFQIKTYLLNNLMPETAGKIITQYMQQFAGSAMRLRTAGIVLLAVTSIMLLLTIDHAFNSIWRVTRPRPLFKRLINSSEVLVLAPLLIGASLSLTSWLVGLSMGYVKNIPVFGMGVLKVLPVLFTTIAFTLLFRLVPNRHVPYAHAVTGAFVAALVFESMNHAFGYYVSHFPAYELVYGAFAVVPIFLMWIYMSWLTILIGAVIAASLSHWRTPAAALRAGRRLPAAEQAMPATQLRDAIRVLQMLSDGLQQGRTCKFPELSRSLHLGYDDLEKILEKLADAGMVRKARKQDWLMARDAGHIRVNELLRLFVLELVASSGVQNGDPVQQWLAGCAGQLEQKMDITLQELFAKLTA